MIQIVLGQFEERKDEMRNVTAVLLLIILSLLCLLTAGCQGNGEGADPFLPEETVLVMDAQGSVRLPERGRQRILINDGWKYRAVKNPSSFTGMQDRDYDDTDWRVVNLPHDACIETSFTPQGNAMGGFFQGTNGFYRKTFQTPENLGDRRMFLQFEGVYMASEIWINEHYLGKFYNGYLDFEYDVTDYLKPAGQTNLIGVSFLYQPDSSRWYTGGGIYRDVYLLVTENLYVSRFGTFFSTPEDIHTVEGKIEVTNSNPSSVSYSVQTVLYDPRGTEVARDVTPAELEPGGSMTVEQTFSISSPQLWSTNLPYLYTAETTILQDGLPVDTYVTTFGIRQIEINGQDGLLLNGEKVLIKGVCLHHDLGALGTAAFERAIERRLEVLQSLGVNSIRLSHNPYSSAILELCDRMGILVFDEAYDKWEINNQYYLPDGNFEDHWREDMTTWIKRDRNHPSVYLWSVGNEEGNQILDQDGRFDTAPLVEKVSFVHELDPTRKVTCALYPLRSAEGGVWTFTEETHPWALAMDVASWNYMQQYFAHDHETYPDVPLLASEVSVDYRAKGFFEFDHSYNVGLYFWGGIEYFGESTGFPYKGWTNGFVDVMGYPKGIAAALKAVYHDEKAEESFIEVSVVTSSQKLLWNGVEHAVTTVDHHWNWEEGESLSVVAYTDCDSVVFSLDGETYQTVPVENRVAECSVPYRAGTLRAAGVRNGKIVCEDVLQTTGQAVKLALLPDYTVLKADNRDMSHIRVTALDEKENAVPVSGISVSFTVEGAGILAGVANGDMASDESFQGNCRQLYQGQAQVIVRSTRETGDIIIRAEADGLEPAEIRLQCVDNPVKIGKTGSGNGCLLDGKQVVLDEAAASRQVAQVGRLSAQADSQSRLIGYFYNGVLVETLPEQIEGQVVACFVRTQGETGGDKTVLWLLAAGAAVLILLAGGIMLFRCKRCVRTERQP